jgi:hypothetical protein
LNAQGVVSGWTLLNDRDARLQWLRGVLSPETTIDVDDRCSVPGHKLRATLWGFLQSRAKGSAEPAALDKAVDRPRVGDPEIQALQRLADATPVKKQTGLTFSISYQGREAYLRVDLKKDDVDELEIWFITQKGLAAEIQKKMREIPERELR